MTSLALVTGASGGIGSAVASRLSSLVDDLVACARTRSALEALDVTGGARLHLETLDVTDPDATPTVAVLVDRFDPDRIVLVNGAGSFGPVGGIGRDDPAEWLRTLHEHVVGAVATMSAVLPRMVERGWGRVVNVSSAQSLHGPDPAAGAYASAKAAVNVMTAGAAAQVEGTEVSVCAIHPGDVDTAMAADIRAGAAAAGAAARHLSDWAATIAGGGGDDPGEAGELVAAIVERPASWSNGRFLIVPSARARHPREGWSMPVGPARASGSDQ